MSKITLSIKNENTWFDFLNQSKKMGKSGSERIEEFMENSLKNGHQ